MSAPNAIKSEKLARLIGTPSTPVIIDVRTEEDFEADPRLIPGALKRSHQTVSEWGKAHAGKSVIVVCHHGAKLSEGTAAWLRQLGADAVALEGGFVDWETAKLPLVPVAKIPKRDAGGRTLWVTRARPKIDRIACPWLIRRFVDPAARFLFVAPGEVADVADRFGATPFDSEGAIFAHRGDLCSFDAMLDDFDLRTKALDRLALVVRGADTGRLDLAPEAAGLLAASLGLSRLHRNDMAQLEAGMGLYDAFYRWARDATGETHDTTADA